MEYFVYRKGAAEVEEIFSAAELPALLADKTNVVWVDFLGETAEQSAEAKDLLSKVQKEIAARDKKK